MGCFLSREKPKRSRFSRITKFNYNFVGGGVPDAPRADASTRPYSPATT